MDVCREYGISKVTLFNWRKSTVDWRPLS
ncbi:hypothetical protein [Dyadobacter sandarakinus]